MHQRRGDIGSSEKHAPQTAFNFAQNTTPNFPARLAAEVTSSHHTFPTKAVHRKCAPGGKKKKPLTLFWRSASCLSELEEVSLRSFHLHLCPAALPLQYYFSLWAEHTIAV